jgi:hypothetical protein
MKKLLILVSLLVGCGQQAPSPERFGSIVPNPQGPAGNCDAGAAVCGTYPKSLVVNLAATDAGVVGHIAPANLATGTAANGSIPVVEDGGVTFHTYPPSTIAIDAGTFGQLPPARIAACTNGTSIVSIGGVETCSLIAIDAGTSGELPTARLVAADAGECLVMSGGVWTGAACPGGGIIAIDAGTKNQLPESRLVNCGTTGQVVTFNGTAMVCGTVATSGVTPGTSGQIYQTNATPAATWNTESGDCTISATGVQTCTQLQSGEIVAGATSGTLTCAAGATACGVAQGTQANGSNPNNVYLTPSAPGASCTGTAPCTPGSVYAQLALPGTTGSPAEPGFLVTSGGAGAVRLGPYSSSFDAIWFGNAALSPTTTNFSFLADTGSASTYLNGGTTLYLNIANAVGITLTPFQVLTSNTWNLGLGAADFGGGYNTIGLAKAVTIPTTSPGTAGDAIIWSGTTPNALHFVDASDTNTHSSAIGWDSTLSGDAIWLGTSTWTDANFQVGSNGSTATVLNTTQQGAFEVGGGSGTNAGGWTAQGLMVGNPSTAQATGAGVLQFAPETSLPTYCSTSLAACVYDNSNTAAVSNGLVVMDHSAMRTTLAPQVATLTGTGTSGADVNVLSDGTYLGVGKTVAGQTLILSVPLTSGSMCDVDFTCITRVTVAGSATTLGNGVSIRSLDAVTDIAGTVALAGGAVTSLQAKGPASFSTLPIQCTPSYTVANTYTLTAISCANCGTLDWTIKAKLLCD